MRDVVVEKASPIAFFIVVVWSLDAPRMLIKGILYEVCMNASLLVRTLGPVLPAESSLHGPREGQPDGKFPATWAAGSGRSTVQSNLEMSHREQFRNVTLVTFLGLRWANCV